MGTEDNLNKLRTLKPGYGKKLTRLSEQLDKHQKAQQKQFEAQVKELEKLYSQMLHGEYARILLDDEIRLAISGPLDMVSTWASLDVIEKVLEGKSEGLPGWKNAKPEELAKKVREEAAKLKREEHNDKEADNGHSSTPSSASSGPLVAFYLEVAPDSQGRKLSEILQWDDNRLEQVHDFIQWLFPLKTASQFVSDAPLLDGKQIAAFQNNEKLRHNLLEAFKRMLKFYGFSYTEDSDSQKPVIRPSAMFEKRKHQWLTPGNHNYRRISRIVTSLRLLGLPEQALAFYSALREVYNLPGSSRLIGQDTFKYWTNASGYKPEQAGK